MSARNKATVGVEKKENYFHQVKIGTIDLGVNSRSIPLTKIEF